MRRKEKGRKPLSVSCREGGTQDAKAKSSTEKGGRRQALNEKKGGGVHAAGQHSSYYKLRGKTIAGEMRKLNSRESHGRRRGMGAEKKRMHLCGGGEGKSQNDGARDSRGGTERKGKQVARRDSKKKRRGEAGLDRAMVEGGGSAILPVCGVGNKGEKALEGVNHGKLSKRGKKTENRGKLKGCLGKKDKLWVGKGKCDGVQGRKGKKTKIRRTSESGRKGKGNHTGQRSRKGVLQKQRVSTTNI